MPNFEKKHFEQPKGKEQYERNVNVTVRLIRHGEKDKEGFLSKAGRKEAQDLGNDFDAKNIKPYVSNKKRVKQTAKEIVEHANAEEEFNMREKESLSASNFVQGDPADSAFLQKVDERLSKAYETAQDKREEALKEAEARNVKEWLEYEDESPDKVVASPREIAEGLATRIETYIHMVDRLKEDSDVDLLNVTHEFMVAAFIKYFLKQEQEDEIKEGGDIIEEFGYRIPPLGGLNITIEVDEKGEKLIGAKMNGQEYELDVEKIKKFAASHGD